ncbi:MAG: aminopeptidase [Planctomycetota bacterium]|jgi:aminopeptidase
MNSDPNQSSVPPAVVNIAVTNVRDILTSAVEFTSDARAVIVADRCCDLAISLSEAYRRCLPDAEFIDFESVDPAQVLAAFEGLVASDLVVLIQSTSFRLDKFRIRLELFKRSLKVIEHPHLARLTEDEAVIYIDSLAYDKSYYRGVGGALKRLIDGADEIVVDSGGEQLVFPGGLEPAKLNVGDYRQLKNVGGQYPIGEVFTESKDLETVNGKVRIGFFGDRSFSVNKPAKPITLKVEGGQVVSATDSTMEFDQVLDDIRNDESVVWLRELGFGMNRAFTCDRVVNDVGSFERMCGVHLSLGAKHASYNKANIRKKSAWYHVDVFVITESVMVDGRVIYRDGGWTVEA